MQKPSLRGVLIFPGSTQFYDVEVKKLCSYSYIHTCNVNNIYYKFSLAVL